MHYSEKKASKNKIKYVLHFSVKGLEKVLDLTNCMYTAS